MSEDRQLREVHLILDFKPISDNFQEVGHAIRAGDPMLRRIDVSMPGFLTRENLPPVELPFQRSPYEVALPREETALSRLSLEVEIDKFYLKDNIEKQGEQVVEVLDSKDELDRVSSVCPYSLVIARLDDNLEDKEEEMALNQRKGLRDLLAGMKKGSESKDVPGS